jgi:hypothetical protein
VTLVERVKLSCQAVHQSRYLICSTTSGHKALVKHSLHTATVILHRSECFLLTFQAEHFNQYYHRPWCPIFWIFSLYSNVRRKIKRIKKVLVTSCNSNRRTKEAFRNHLSQHCHFSKEENEAKFEALWQRSLPPWHMTVEVGPNSWNLAQCWFHCTTPTTLMTQWPKEPKASLWISYPE